MEHSTASKVNGPMKQPTSVSKLQVAVTPVQELVVDVDDDVLENTTANACHVIPLFFGKVRPHREYQLVISEEVEQGDDGNAETTSENDAGIGNSKSSDDHNNHAPLRIQTQMRFSTFHKHFTSTSMQHLTRKTRLSIPSKGFLCLEDYTHSMDNVLERARRMQLFLWDTLDSNGPELLQSDLLHEALSLSAKDRQGLSRIAERRQMEAQRAKHEMEAIQKKRAKDRTEAQQKASQEEQKMWNLVQTLNVTNLDTRSTFTFQPYHQPMQFEINRRWFTFGNENSILGGRKGYNNNKQKWFHLERTDFPRINPFSDLTYQLRTMKGVPLLEMKERFRMMDYVCDLYYVLGNGQRVPAVTVQRQFQWGGWTGEEFNVIGRGPLAKTRFECQGPWLQETIRMNGMFAGVLDQHFISFAAGHTLTVAPNQDCLLVLGIACAVVRIHAARQD